MRDCMALDTPNGSMPGRRRSTLRNNVVPSVEHLRKACNAPRKERIRYHYREVGGVLWGCTKASSAVSGLVVAQALERDREGTFVFNDRTNHGLDRSATY